MKELSTEEKAQAYDEALEKARQLCAYPTTKPFINDLQDLFPELKESEDEQIREYLIRYIDNTMKSSELKSKLLAWLEKQGEQKPTWSEEDEEFLKRAIKATKDLYPITSDWLKNLKQRIAP